MAIDKISLLKVFSLTCKYGKKVYYHNLLNKLESVERNFSKPSVRFRTNVWDLYDCLTRLSTMPIEEDLTLFRYESIVISTTSSEAALAFLEAVIEGERVKKEFYFKQFEVLKPVKMIDWYSNLYSFQKFIESGVVVAGLWCALNPNQEDGPSQDQVIPVMNQVLLDFLGGREFRVILNDLISVSRFNLERNLRLLND